MRRVQPTYVNDWIDPRKYITQLRKARETEEAASCSSSMGEADTRPGG